MTKVRSSPSTKIESLLLMPLLSFWRKEDKVGRLNPDFLLYQFYAILSKHDPSSSLPPKRGEDVGGGEFMNLIEYLIKSGYLKTPLIIEAFKKIKRIDFLPESLKYLAEIDEALSIGFGQTISQPAVVAFMIELLEPKEGNKVLDIGAGSGWTTALLAEIVGHPHLNPPPPKEGEERRGRVIAIEIIPELVEYGKKNVSKYNFVEKGIVEFVLADGSKGYPKEALFDRILVSASADSIPQALKDQLKIGGRLVIPILNSIWLFLKKDEKKFEEKEFSGFVFVPLIEKP